MSSTSHVSSSKKSLAKRWTLLLDLTGLPCARVDPVAVWEEDSFLVWWWWVWRLWWCGDGRYEQGQWLLFPVQEWSPCECSPVLGMGVFRLFIEPEDFHIVCVDNVNEVFERLEVETFFFDESDDHVLFVAIGSKDTWWEGGGSVESDM